MDLAATVSPVVPHIRLNWTQKLQANISTQRIHRRLKGQTVWTKLADLTTTATGHSDATCLPGVEYEYWLERNYTGLASSYMPVTAVGYLSAGYNVPAPEGRGKLLLVIDSTMSVPLAAEINQVESDLVGDGWRVQRIPVLRTSSVVAVKSLIRNAYSADPANVRMVYLLGHVPVPYSGNNASDGHWQHLGAWSADGYYGDMNGVWTDSVVNSTGATSLRNRNVSGDGKFDPSVLPSTMELAVGRVDMWGMTKAPSAVITETELLRRYLAKAHAYRHQLGAYASIPRRALVWDGLTSYMTGLTGWHWAYTGLGKPPAVAIDRIATGQWFSTNYAGGRSYLIGYAGGYGSYESLSGVGTTTDFGTRASRVVFMGMFGSYFGDWDSPNNLMRSVLAGNSKGDSLGLGCIWAGAPNYFMHHMGMGESIGYSVRASQNGPLPGGSALKPGGPRWGPQSAFGGVHTGLMGDPALRLHTVEPPRKAVAESSAGRVTLSWAASTETDLVGYHVYRAIPTGGPYVRLTAAPLRITSFSEARNAGEVCHYLIKTVVIERVPGGTYINQSQGTAVSLVVSSSTDTSGAPAQILGPFSNILRIGQDDNPSARPYTPYAEFSSENGRSDPAPGKVTRLPGDPLYSAATNPSRDDDYYCVGTFPAGFNGLTASMRVPVQEPATAWEYSLTQIDRTNRVHFVLNSAQANPASRLRLDFDFVVGGFYLGAPLNRMGVGFAQHDIVIRFKNATGLSTAIYTNRFDQPGKVSLEFSAKAVGASMGANSIEFVRVGPTAPVTSYWIIFDFVSLDAAVPTSGISGAATMPAGLGGIASFASGSIMGFAGPAVEAGSQGQETDSDSVGLIEADGREFLTLTYLRPVEVSPGTSYHVEGSGDLHTWSSTGLVELESPVEGSFRRITIRDSTPIGEDSRRFMRVRIVQEASE